MCHSLLIVVVASNAVFMLEILKAEKYLKLNGSLAQNLNTALTEYNILGLNVYVSIYSRHGATLDS